MRGAQGGYRLGVAPDELRLATIVAPFLPPTEHRCIMGRTRCQDDAPCGAHARWKAVNETAHAFFAELTIAELLAPGSQDEAARFRATETSPESATEQAASASGPVIPRITDNPRANAPEIR